MITLRLLSTLTAAACLPFASSGRASDAPNRGGIAASPSLKLAMSASTKPGADGFLSRWLLLEPIPGDGRVVDSAIREAAKKEYFPNQYSIMPRAGDNVTSGGVEYFWHAVDSSKHNVNLYHFEYFNNKPTTNQVFWGVTVVDCPEEVSGVRLAVGSNAGSVWWVNGEEAVGIYGDRQCVVDDGVSKKLTLKKGPNVVRFMVVNNRGMVDCCARFLETSGKPVTRFTLSLSDATGLKTQ